MLRVYQASRKNTIDTPSPSMHFLGSNDSQAFKKTQKLEALFTICFCTKVEYSRVNKLDYLFRESLQDTS